MDFRIIINKYKTRNFKEKHLNSDVKFIKSYCQYFSCLGIFPLCLKEKHVTLRLILWRFYLCILWICFLVGALATFMARFKFMHVNTQLIQIVLDSLRYINLSLFILTIITSTFRNSSVWRSIFEDLAEVDNILKSRKFYVKISVMLHVLKIGAYHVVLHIVHLFILYLWKDNFKLYYCNIFKIVVQCYQLIVFVFLCEMANILSRRYTFIHIEIRRIFFEDNPTNWEVIDNEREDIKHMYGILNDITGRFSTAFGPHIFLTLSSLFIYLLNSFVWFLFDVDQGLLLARKVLHVLMEPLIFSVSTRY